MNEQAKLSSAEKDLRCHRWYYAMFPVSGHVQAYHGQLRVGPVLGGDTLVVAVIEPDKDSEEGRAHVIDPRAAIWTLIRGGFYLAYTPRDHRRKLPREMRKWLADRSAWGSRRNNRWVARFQEAMLSAVRKSEPGAIADFEQ